MSKKKSKTAPSQVNPIGKSRAPFLLWLDSRQAEWILLGAILILATALRFYDSTSPLMWMDELSSIGVTTGQFNAEENSPFFPLDIVVNNPINHSSILSAGPLSKCWKHHTENDVHPPLYHSVLYFWRYCFGDSFLSVRMPSILSSILAVLILYLLTKSLFDRWTAFWASLLMTLATPQIIYAQEVRGYALLTLLGLTAVFMLTRIENLGPTIQRAALLGIFSFGLAFTHYFSFGLLLAMAIYTALRLRGKVLVYTIAGFAFGGVIFLAVWGPQMWNQFFGTSLEFNKYDTFRQNAEIAKQIPDLVAGWAERLFFHLPNEFATRPPQTLLIYLLPAVAIFWRKNLLLPWLWLICTMGFVALLDLKRETFHFTQIRYTLLAAPAVYMIVAAGVFNGKWKMIYNSLLPALLSIFLIINIPKVYIPCKERWFEIADLIKENGNPNEIIILPHAGQSFQLYWPRFIWMAISYYIYDSNRPMIIPTKPLTQEAMSQIGWGKEAWVITRFPEFQQANSLNWAPYWVPGCQVKGGWVAQAGATVFHIKLPEAPSQ
jgi:uncharacterized membrane protein